MAGKKTAAETPAEARARAQKQAGETIARVRELIARYGVAPTARAVGQSRTSLMAVASGSARMGTILVTAQNLAAAEILLAGGDR